MFKKKLIPLFFILITASSIVVGQVRVTYKGKRLVAVRGLISEDLSPCGSFTYTGTVVRVKGEYPEMILELRTKTGKQTIGFNTSELSMADNSNLYYFLLKRGVRLKAKGLICGSGAFNWANSFESF